jgi:hypothetical protein
MKSLSLLTSSDFLEIKKCPNQGSYGTTIFCKLSAQFGKLPVVVKVNGDPGSDLEHEYNVGMRLKQVGARGFSRPLHFFREGDTQFLVLEKIRSEQSMLEAMLVMTPEQILSTVRQLVVFLWEAQKAARFVHNDLHLNNVLITKTSMKYFSLGSRKFPTHGLSPVIIDFGFSHFDRWRLFPVLSQCTQTHRGMNPFVFNEKFDFLTLLHGVRKDCGFDRKLKNTIDRMLESVGEDKFYKNRRWRKMFHSLFDLMILACEFPTTAPDSLETVDPPRDADEENWKTIKVESEKLVQENLLSQVIRKIDPKKEGAIVDFSGEWDAFRRTGEAGEKLVAGLEFVFAQFLKHAAKGGHRKPMSQKNIEKLLDSSTSSTAS